MYVCMHVCMYVCIHMCSRGHWHAATLHPQRLCFAGCVLVIFSLFSRYFVCALVIFSLFARYFLVIFTACSLFIRYFACVLVIYFISSLFVRYVVWPRYVFVMSFECVLVICSSFSFVLDTEKPTQQLHYCVASLWSLIRSGLEHAQQNLELPQHTAFD